MTSVSHPTTSNSKCINFGTNKPLCSSLQLSKHQQMTVLLYVKDHLKTQLKAEQISFFFDEENLTSEEEILEEAMIEEVLVKAKKGSSGDL
jgi:hypothetical protein